MRQPHAIRSRKAFVQPARRDDRSCRVDRRFVSRCLSRCLPSAGAFGFGFESHRPAVALDAASGLPHRPPTSRTACETRTLFIRMTNQLLDGRPSAGACLDACQRRRNAPGPVAMRATHACDGRMKRTRIVGRDSVPSVIRSPRAEVGWAPEIFGASCLQHGALRIDLFSFSCPRLKYSLTVGMRSVDPVRSTSTPAAPGYMQGAHHLAQRHAWRGSAIGRRETRAPGRGECFRVETRDRGNRFGTARRWAKPGAEAGRAQKKSRLGNRAGIQSANIRSGAFGARGRAPSARRSVHADFMPARSREDWPHPPKRGTDRTSTSRRIRAAPAQNR